MLFALLVVQSLVMHVEGVPPEKTVVDLVNSGFEAVVVL